MGHRQMEPVKTSGAVFLAGRTSRGQDHGEHLNPVRVKSLPSIEELRKVHGLTFVTKEDDHEVRSFRDHRDSVGCVDCLEDGHPVQQLRPEHGGVANAPPARQVILSISVRG